MQVQLPHGRKQVINCQLVHSRKQFFNNNAPYKIGGIIFLYVLYEAFYISLLGVGSTVSVFFAFLACQKRTITPNIMPAQ